MAAMNESGLEFNPMFEVQSDFTQATAVQAMDELLARANRPTALFCESDEMAFGALISARRHGMSVPDDISIVGFDNHEMAAFAGLTTISQPVRMLGEMAAWSIRDKLNNPASEAKSFCLPTNLIVRSTTARIN
jgi:DNA-binding LacI/PurR family transcriptional regulator